MSRLFQQLKPFVIVIFYDTQTTLHTKLPCKHEFYASPGAACGPALEVPWAVPVAGPGPLPLQLLSASANEA